MPVIPAGKHPGQPTTLGNHEDRIRALERQRIPDAKRPVGIYKNEGDLPITVTTGAEQLAIGMDTLQTNDDGLPYFDLDISLGGLINPGFYSLSCWVQFDNAIDWSVEADPFHSPIINLFATGTGVDVFGLADYHMVEPDGPILWQINNFGYWNVHTQSPINLMLTVPLDGGFTLSEGISFPPHIVAVRICDDFAAVPGISGT